MPHSFLTLILTMFLVASCTSIEDRPDHPAFSDLSQSFLSDYWKVHPSHASHIGLADFDSLLEIPDKVNREKKLAFYKTYIEKFKATDDSDLSLSQLTDKKLILNELNFKVWRLEEFKEYQWNPSHYNLGSEVSAVLNKENRSLEKRFTDLSEKLLKSQEYYQAAKNSINQPSEPHLKLAIEQTKGFVDYLDGEVLKSLKKSNLESREKTTAEQRIKATAAAAKRFVTFLRGALAKPSQVNGFGSFRIGSDNYKKKFEYQLQIESTPLELYRQALRAKDDARSKMFEAAIALYPKYYGEKLPPKDRKKVIDDIMKKVVVKHAKPDEFVEKIRQQLPELTQFVNQKNLLTLDPKRPLKVRVMPPYERGFAGASVDSPGPFDKERETFYNVSPLTSMTKKQKESYLREYNDYTLQILNIHEAIPGHYVQLVYSNKSPSIIKSIFQNGPMIEGWAVYAERMMLEEGYGGDNPEMWLMYYKWFLRVVTNTIIDYEIHNKDLTKKQAMKYMVDEAYQEKAEAEGKWHRATVSSVQLASYYAGFTEIYQLREDLKKQQGDEFSLKQFHEQFLSYGSAPIKEIKRLML